MVIIAFYFYNTIQQTTTYKQVSTVVLFQNQSNRTNTKTWGKILFTWVPGGGVFTKMTKIVQGRRCLVSCWLYARWIHWFEMSYYPCLVFPPVCAAATVFVSALDCLFIYYFILFLCPAIETRSPDGGCVSNYAVAGHSCAETPFRSARSCRAWCLYG